MQIKKGNGLTRGYIRLSKTWYAAGSLLEEPIITIGYYYPNSPCTTGEMSIVWKKIRGEMLPRLEVFDECWDLLLKFSDLVTEMAKLSNKHISGQDFTALLDGLGYTDFTQYTKQLKTKQQTRIVRDDRDSGLKM